MSHDFDYLRVKYLEILIEAEGERLSPEMRQKHATIVRTKSDGTKEYKFPIPDKKHARLALSMIDQSDLTSAEKTKVRNAANKMLGRDGEEKMEEAGWDKPWTKEDESKMSDDEKKKMQESWGKMSDDEKKKMMKEYGSYGPKMKKKMMEGWGMKKNYKKEM